MANKQELVAQLDSLLPEGVVINSDDYTKKEIEAMINLGAKGESFEHLFKHREDTEEAGEAGKPGGRSIMIDDTELLAKIGATEPVARADYIRQRFEQGTHRREITNELGVAYQIIFAATKEMFNKHHAPGKRGGRSSMVTVTNEEGEEEQIGRSDYMRQQYQLGRNRSDIASELGVSYGLVYAATKDVERDEEVVAAYRKEHYGEDPDEDLGEEMEGLEDLDDDQDDESQEEDEEDFEEDDEEAVLP